MNMRINQGIVATTLFQLLCKDLAYNALKKIVQSKAGIPYTALSFALIEAALTL